MQNILTQILPIPDKYKAARARFKINLNLFLNRKYTYILQN